MSAPGHFKLYLTSKIHELGSRQRQKICRRHLRCIEHRRQVEKQSSVQDPREIERQRAREAICFSPEVEDRPGAQGGAGRARNSRRESAQEVLDGHLQQPMDLLHDPEDSIGNLRRVTRQGIQNDGSQVSFCETNERRERRIPGRQLDPVKENAASRGQLGPGEVQIDLSKTFPGGVELDVSKPYSVPSERLVQMLDQAGEVLKQTKNWRRELSVEIQLLAADLETRRRPAPAPPGRPCFAGMGRRGASHGASLRHTATCRHHSRPAPSSLSLLPADS